MEKGEEWRRERLEMEREREGWVEEEMQQREKGEKGKRRGDLDCQEIGKWLLRKRKWKPKDRSKNRESKKGSEKEGESNSDW